MSREFPCDDDETAVELATAMDTLGDAKENFQKTKAALRKLENHTGPFGEAKIYLGKKINEVNARANAKLAEIKRQLNPGAAFHVKRLSADTVPNFSVVTNEAKEKLVITRYRNEPPVSESEASDTGTSVEDPLDRTKQVSALWPNYEAMLRQQDERMAEYQENIGRWKSMIDDADNHEILEQVIEMCADLKFQVKYQKSKVAKSMIADVAKRRKSSEI
ncbi:hypothetical protein Ddc_11382 [Ditylenchus destructor]|nr:hypothetical protein Ddc_11382 [Ditylenchus destructor]